MRFLALFCLLFSVVSCVNIRKSPGQILDKIYLVNLDRTPDRYLGAKENLEKASLEFSRFSASDGYNINILDQNTGKSQNAKIWWNSCKAKSQYSKKPSYEVFCDDDKENNITLQNCRSLGEIGCYCSMRRVWKDILQNNYRYSLILEDDTRINEKDISTFKSQIKTLIENAPLNWDVIYLHLHNRHDKLYPARKVLDKIENEYVWGINRDPAYSLGSTIAYIVNRNFAEKMYVFSKNMNFPVDMQIADAINKRIINGYKAKKQLVIVGSDSVIDNMGRNEDGELK